MMGFNTGLKVLILFIMLFLHIVDDYYLQGVFAKLKQKSWWEENAPNALYRHDYKIALLEHGFSWAFVVMLPVLVCMICTNNIDYVWYIIVFVTNMLLHAWIDDCKANKQQINLIMDQICHLWQVVWIWLTFFT